MYTIRLLMLTMKEPLNASNYIDTFMKCFGEHINEYSFSPVYTIQPVVKPV